MGSRSLCSRGQCDATRKKRGEIIQKINTGVTATG